MTKQESFCPHCHSYIIFYDNPETAECDLCGWKYSKTNHEYQKIFKDKIQQIVNPYPEPRSRKRRHKWNFTLRFRRS